ncbi:Vitelline membrane outer layer protein 1 [Mactra antiquata]
MNSNFSNSVLILLVAVAAVNAAARFPVEESDLLNDHDIVMVMTNDNYDDSTETDDQAEVRLDGPYPEADWLEENSAEYSSSAEELRDPTVIRPGALDIEGYVFDTNRVTKTLTVDNGGHHGTWGEASFCPKHSFGAGYNMKIEPKQGSGDDTSLNAIKIVCKGLDGDVRGNVASKVGPWGHYVGDKYCKGTSSNTDFLTAFRLQVEPYGGFWKGDTAANYVEFKCRNLNGNTMESQKSRR